MRSNAHISSHLHLEIEALRGWIKLSDVVSFCHQLHRPARTPICTHRHTHTHTHTHTHVPAYIAQSIKFTGPNRGSLLFFSALLAFTRTDTFRYIRLDDRQSSPPRPCSYVPFNELKQCVVSSDGRHQGA